MGPLMLRDKKHENLSHRKAITVIQSLEAVIRNFQLKLKSANNEITQVKRENKRAVREKDNANNTLDTLRGFKLVYLDHLLKIGNRN